VTSRYALEERRFIVDRADRFGLCAYFEFFHPPARANNAAPAAGSEEMDQKVL